MSGWAQGRLALFDTETDGPDPLDARIITATVLFVGGQQERTDRQWLLRTERPIPAEATAVHGITTQRADTEGVDRAEAVEQIAAQVAGAFAHGVPLCAFNAAYDLTVLDQECRRLGLLPLAGRLAPGALLGPVIDPFVIDKEVDRYRRGKRTLGATCEQYGIDLGEAHDATADALGAGRLAWALAKRFPREVGEVSAVRLHELQAVWRARQSESLQAYFKSQGKDDVVDGSWPLRQVGEAVA